MSKRPPPPPPSKPTHLASKKSISKSPPMSSKRGLGWPWDYPASHFPIYTSYNKITWLFNWELWVPPGLPSSIEWVPCVRTPVQAKDVIPFLSDIIGNKKADVKYLLGFNEPEIPDQANMSVEEAVKLWRDVVVPAKSKFGLKLGSPGVSSDVGRSKPWLNAFFEQLGEEAQVDFLVVHWYGLGFGDFKAYLEDMHRTYNMPLWVNEFACSTMGNGEVSTEDVEAFMKEAVPWLDGCEWVERYAYFGNGQGKTVGGWVGKKNDFCEPGEGCEGSDGRRLTGVGKLYAEL